MMTSTQRKWMEETGFSAYDYVAHLEDALMTACSDYNKETGKKDLCVEDRFWQFLRASEINHNTGESLWFTPYEAKNECL